METMNILLYDNVSRPYNSTICKLNIVRRVFVLTKLHFDFLNRSTFIRAHLSADSLHGLVAQQIVAIHPRSRMHFSDMLVETERPLAVYAAVGAGESWQPVAVVPHVLDDAALGGEAFWALGALEILGGAAVGGQVVGTVAGYRQLDDLRDKLLTLGRAYEAATATTASQRSWQHLHCPF